MRARRLFRIKEFVPSQRFQLRASENRQHPRCRSWLHELSRRTSLLTHRKLFRPQYRQSQRLESPTDIPAHRATQFPSVPRLNRESTAPDLRSDEFCRATASGSRTVPQDCVRRNRQFSGQRRQRGQNCARGVRECPRTWRLGPTYRRTISPFPAQYCLLPVPAHASDRFTHNGRFQRRPSMKNPDALFLVH